MVVDLTKSPEDMDWLNQESDEGVEPDQQLNGSQYDFLTFDSKEQAEAVAELLGCSGSHEHEDGHMPCDSHERFEELTDGSVVRLRGLSDEALEYVLNTYDVELVE